MNRRRLWAVMRLELSQLFRRPLFWILLFLLVLMTWGLSDGFISISSGDSTVGGKKAWLTSEFAVAQVLSMLVLLLYTFFSAVAGGMGVIQDEEYKVGEILHATPLKPAEYVWGRFLAVLIGFLVVLAFHLATMGVVNHLIPNAEAADIRGPFAWRNYLIPALLFGVPTLVFTIGGAFAVGTLTRRAVLVFVLPVAILLACGFFLWDWSPTWLDPRINRALMFIDPTGFRWLTETYLKVDRGVEFYNTAPIAFDALFLLNRAAVLALGFGAVALSRWRFEATLRGVPGGRSRTARAATDPSPNPVPAVAAPTTTPLPAVADPSPNPLPMAGRGQGSGLFRKGQPPAQADPHPPPGRPTTPFSNDDWDASPLIGEGPGERSLPRDAGGGPGASIRHTPLAALRMSVRPPGGVRTLLEVVRIELKGLFTQPGLYIYVPLIIVQLIGSSFTGIGAFDTPLLFTSGLLAARSMNVLIALVCLLLMFYTVESLERDARTGLEPLVSTAPVPTGALLFGKALANSLVGVVVVLAALAAAVIALAMQGKVSIDLRIFGLVWGGLLVPTYVLWSAFIMAAFAITRSRYTSYALGLAALGATFYFQITRKLTWAGNWALFSTTLWTDIGWLELDRRAFVLNRLAALTLAVFFVALATRLYARRDRDAVGIAGRLRPRALLKSARWLIPLALVPATLVVTLWLEVNDGFQGTAAKKAFRQYWQKNVVTWLDAPLPALSHVDLDLELDPSSRHFRTSGTFELVNHLDVPLDRIPLTGGAHWEQVAWTLNGQPYTPEDRAKLYVFTPPARLEPGDHLSIGFRLEGTFPHGITKNGLGTTEFILPSGVVATGFKPSIAPLLGYLDPDEVDKALVDKDYKLEPRTYGDHFYEGVTPAAYGSGVPFTSRIRITGPADFTYNSVGTLESDTLESGSLAAGSVTGGSLEGGALEAGRRTMVWTSDHPVSLFNVVAGRWAVREGQGTRLFYHPDHRYNIDEMGQALDAARRYYSEWFRPFPWAELKLSEFPGLAGYAQGFPTNITFSESIGFLTESSPRSNAAFLVTAHEAAHQWWGNMLIPGRGPGGNLLSEGTSHFSSILLMERVKGLEARIELCKRLEERYARDRQVDSELPLVRIDGSREGDTTVTYDKGGWVFWMLQQHMGREANLRGLQAFLEHYADDRDHPVLQDFVAFMRPFAPDPSAYDDFVQQWFYQVVLPEYRLSDARLKHPDAGTWVTTVTVENRGTGRMPVEVAAVAGRRFAEPADVEDEVGDASRGARGVENEAGTASRGARGVENEAGNASRGARGVENEAGNASRGARGVENEAGTTSRGDRGVENEAGTASRGDRGVENEAGTASRGDRGVENEAGTASGGAPQYREARARVTPGAGGREVVTLISDFAPERLVVDPDAVVLQLHRELAVAPLP